MRPVLLTVLLLTGAWTGSAGEIVAIGPNPVAPDDRGEYLVLSFPAPTPLGEWSITDGETVVTLPDRTVSGRVVLARDPDAVEPWVSAPVLALEGRLALANGGETVVLRHRGRDVDRVTYRRAPEGRRYERTAGGWQWRREGLTDRPTVRSGPATAEVFVLPDSPGVPLDLLSTATERVLIGAYTFTSRRTAAVLCRVRHRNVSVRLLVDGSPVGGMSRRQASTLDSMTACGVDVTVVGGPYDRYAFHHAKYAVVDDRAVVMTENWKPSGSGGRSNRGWGVVIDDPVIARGLAETYVADTGWRDAIPWREYRSGRTFADATPANGTYRTRHPPERVTVSVATVLVTPDNAAPALVALLDNATSRIDIQQVSIGGRGSPLVRATLRAARRGVKVRLLLSGAWYLREENRERARVLRRLARQEGLPLKVRVVNPTGRFGKLHSKGVIVDGETVIVGSVNWNNNSLRRNREVAVVLEGEAAAAYYTEVFVGDWRGGQWVVTVGVILVAIGTVAGVGRWAAKSFEFDGAGGPDRRRLTR